LFYTGQQWKYPSLDLAPTKFLTADYANKPTETQSIKGARP